MSIEATHLSRTISPARSGNSSPVTTRFRAPGDDGTLHHPLIPLSAILTVTATGLNRKDKSYRRYASAVERALSLFDSALQVWADYIAFLGRLQKVLEPTSRFSTRLLMCHRQGPPNKTSSCRRNPPQGAIVEEACPVPQSYFALRCPPEGTGAIYPYLQRTSGEPSSRGFISDAKKLSCSVMDWDETCSIIYRDWRQHFHSHP